MSEIVETFTSFAPHNEVGHNEVGDLKTKDIYRCSKCLFRCFFRVEEVRVQYVNSQDCCIKKELKIINHSSCQGTMFNFLYKVEDPEELLEL